MASFRPNVVLGVTTVVVLLILFSLAQEMNRRLQIQREVTRLTEEVNVMEKHIIELEQLNEYFKTADYKERLAREQLNFRAPGEKVVLIPESSSQTVAKAAEKKEDTGPTSIPLKWWYTFFVDAQPK